MAAENAATDASWKTELGRMLRQRLLVSLLLLPVGIAAIVAEGPWFLALVAILLALAAWEFALLFSPQGLSLPGPLVVTGVLAIVLARSQAGFALDPWLLPLLIFLAMANAVFQYERGREHAGTEFALTLAGIFYLGILGGFFLSLRELENGQWWLLLALPPVWLADSAAYYFGTRFGRRKMTKRVSPNKSWTGYFSGALAGAVGAVLLLFLYQRMGLPSDSAFNVPNVALLGLAMGLLPTLGDLGISMLKRQVGVKDTGTLLPGHGGILDRIDSWLWAIPISYYLIQWVFLN